jgi:predicted porin
MLLSHKSTEISSMKKTLLAAALLAGFAGVAQAETQVTLYGIIDTGIAYGRFTKADGSKVTNVGMGWGGQSGSRWGMKGTEELGDGLKAIFQLESGFDSTNGFSAQGGRLMGRQAWVGLANASWGQVTLGRVYSAPTTLLPGAIDPFQAGWGMANLGTTMGSLNTDRLDNGILYVSPVFAGFQFAANYSFNTADSGSGMAKNQTNDNNRQMDVAASYTNGPLFIGAGYTQLNPAHNTNFNDATIREYVVGAAYNFGFAKLQAAYSRSTDGFIGGTAATLDSDGSPLSNLTGKVAAKGIRQNSYMVGFTAPIGAATNVFGSWQHSTIGKAGNLGGNWLTYGGQGENIFSLGSTYSLSKRTNLYAVASYGKGYANVNGQKATDVIVGIRHQF